MQLGNVIRQIREQNGLTQLELAAAIGITQAGLSLIETGRRRDTRLTTLVGVAKALGIGVDELIRQASVPAPVVRY